jgi:hypothetical protein
MSDAETGNCWGDGPMWIRPTGDDPPECNSHGDVSYPRQTSTMTTENGQWVEYQLRDGFRLFYCPKCFTDGTTSIATPAATVVNDDVRRRLGEYMEANWDKIESYFEHAGDAAPADLHAAVKTTAVRANHE